MLNPVIHGNLHKNVGIVFASEENILHYRKKRRFLKMKDNERGLNGLIGEVLAQMRERKYGQKIYRHYQYSFLLLKSIAVDLGKYGLSEDLVEAFLDSPVNCGERWAEKERTHRKRCIKMVQSLAESGMIDWGRQKPESICGLLHVEVFRMELENFLKQMEEDGLSPNTTGGYKRIVTYFLLFCQESGYGSLTDLRTNDVSRFIASLYHDGKYRPTTIGSALSGLRKFLSGNTHIERFLLEIPSHLPREVKIIEVYSKEELEAIEGLLVSRRMTMRDTAVCRLLLETGLRATDVCSLKLKDIDWEMDAIYICQDKTKKPLAIPLRASYGNAIADYILNERPESKDVHVFLKNTAPFGKLGAGAVRPILQKMEQLAGVQKEGRMSGSRMTRRHTASSMLRSGVSMPDISAVLGHRDPNIVSVYLSTDAASLAACTLPLPIAWKGGDADA